MINPEIRLNDDGTLDEIVGNGFFRLEQMDNGRWWLGLYGDNSSVCVVLTARGRIKAEVVDVEYDLPEQPPPRTGYITDYEEIERNEFLGSDHR